jgi:isopentenyl-diphosphate delta-isomerase
VYTGTFDGEPVVNEDEVAAYRWISMEELIREVSENPELFTSWFRIILNKYLQQLHVA